MNLGHYLLLMCLGYLVTIAIETAVLVFALSQRHSIRTRIFAGIWLTACTYPIVWLVLPSLVDPKTNRTLYLIVAETFAPAAECLLFWLAFERPSTSRAHSAAGDDRPVRVEKASRFELLRDMLAVVIANLASFGFGLLLQEMGVWKHFQ